MLRIKQGSRSSIGVEKLVPLKQVHVDAKIRSFAADVTLTQVFQNDESVSVEAVYCFPIEENAAIYEFIARIDDEREIIAEIKEKKTAQQEYIQALVDGHGAYLMEQDEASNDIFIINLGALKPDSKCQIKISYVSELDLLHTNKAPTIRFVVPTTIAPRYSPLQKRITSPGQTQVPYAESVPYTIEFDCQVEKIDQQIACISSPSHPIKVDCSKEDIYRVTLTQQGVELDRDIIVDVTLSEIRKNTIAAIDKNAVMISFIPSEHDCRIESNYEKSEFFFIIDCSGSMEGDNKIGLARKAILLFLKSLPVDCRFNIIRFGSRFSALFTEQVTREYNQMNMSQAVTMINDMNADLGGTELLEPLRWLKMNRPPAGYIRQIFLLTDGEVSNVTEVINLCREMSAYTRFFSFGLGHSPSRALVKGLARATNGYSSFIAPNTNVDIYVAEQLARALQPSLIDVTVKWNTSQRILNTVPEKAPVVFFGDRLIFYGLLDETMSFDHTTTAELFTSEQKQCIGLVRIDHVPSVTGSQSVMRLAAKALIRELLNNDQIIDKQALINASIKYGILCPHTAFIGVERRLNANSESNSDMELREVPIMINKSESQLFSIHPMLMQQRESCMTSCEKIYKLDCIECKPEAAMFARPFLLEASKLSGSRKSIVRPIVNFVTSLFNRRSSEKPVSSSQLKSENHSTSDGIKISSPISNSSNSQSTNVMWPKEEQAIIDRFIELQQYDGLWALTEDDIKQLTGKSLDEFSSSTIDKLEKNTQQSAITTALVIIILETRCISFKTLWQALLNKATTCLKGLLDGDESKLDQFMNDIRGQYQ